MSTESKAAQELRELAVNWENGQFRYYSKLIKSVLAELAAAEAKFKLLNEDTCDDDTKIRDLCRPFLTEATCDHDGYGQVPIVNTVENITKQLAAANKRLAWFDANKPEDMPDVQEAVIAKLGLVNGEGYEQCRQKLAAVTADRTALGLLVMAGDESIKEARAILEYAVNDIPWDSVSDYQKWLDRARAWLEGGKG